MCPDRANSEPAGDEATETTPVSGLAHIARWIVWAQAINAAFLLCVTLSDRERAPRWIAEAAPSRLDLMFYSLPITPVAVIIISTFARMPPHRKIYLRVASIALSLVSAWIMLPLFW